MNTIQFFDLAFVAKRQEFNHIYTFQFKPTEPFPFTAGQWLHIGFPGPNRDKSMVRHMSFAASPNHEFLEFTMDLSSNTPFKAKINSLVPGEVMSAFKIKGEFVVLPEENNEVVFLSGGIGITPVRSILNDLEHKNCTVNWSLLHVSRDEFLYEQEFSRFSNMQHRVNREGIDSVWNHIVDKPVGTKYYLSGSLRFVDGMKDRLLNSNVLPENIKTEDFH